MEEWQQEQHEEQEEQGLSPHAAAAAAGCRSSIFEKAIEPNGHRH